MWTENDGVALHYLDSLPDSDGSLIPLLFVPGFGEEALDHLDLVSALAPRRVVVADLRGRGPSHSPADSYDLAAHVADLGAIATAAALDRAHVASYSRGTAYALRWALDNAGHVVSIAVGDYPAAQIAPPLEVIPAIQARERFGRPTTERVPAWVIAKVIEQAHSESYYDELSALTTPLLVVHGTRRSAMVGEAVREDYLRARPDVRLVAVDDGHDLWRHDPDAFPRAIRAFLDEVDRSAE